MASNQNALTLTRHSQKHLNNEITEDGIAIITMNRPEKLNGWTMPMMDAFKEALSQANQHPSVKAIIFTGNGKYYSAGVNLSGTLKIKPPNVLHRMLVSHNKALFETFLLCEKPILIAVNGPAIGASVTSATLCNGVIAAESATFSTPFAALGITPEGCSSVHFARLMGEQSAQRMLGIEGWKPTAKEAHAAGLIQWVVPDDQLLAEAKRIAREWISAGQKRTFLGGSELEELLEVNAKESQALADAFLGAEFMHAQSRFLWRKKKRVPSLIFFSLWATRPIWSKLL
jgi:enoyl-CoA hydratase/carnithine racemase